MKNVYVKSIRCHGFVRKVLSKGMCNSLFRLIWRKLTENNDRKREEQGRVLKGRNKNGKQFVTVCRFFQQEADQSSYLLTRWPTPSMTTSTVLPGFMEPTPTVVPQEMMSPGSRVMSWEIMLTSLNGRKIMSATG